MSLQQPAATRHRAAVNGRTGGTTGALRPHDRAAVTDLFDQYESLVESNGSDDEKQALAARICAMLATHASIDAKPFDPIACEALVERKAPDERGLLDDGSDSRQATARDLIEQIRSMEFEEPRPS